jgi:hypothetical protein
MKRPDRQPDRPHPDDEDVLGTLADEPRDGGSQLESPAGRGGRQPRSETPAGRPPEHAEPDVTTNQPGKSGRQAGKHEPDAEEPLTLPEGAWIALRRSGGFLFRTDEVVVYPDGRVVTAGAGGGRAAHLPETRQLRRSELSALRRAVEHAGLDDGEPLRRTAGSSPDAYVYEIALEHGGHRHAFEVTQGRLPPALVPLIRQLTALLAPGD